MRQTGKVDVEYGANLFLVEPPAELATRDEYRHQAMLVVLRPAECRGPAEACCRSNDLREARIDATRPFREPPLHRSGLRTATNRRSWRADTGSSIADQYPKWDRGRLSRTYSV